jgi:hypothetical protein
MSVVFGELSPGVANAARLIRAEFLDMPGMRLTEWQVRRLWNLSQSDGREALDYLCETGCLARDAAGRYLLSRSED